MDPFDARHAEVFEQTYLARGKSWPAEAEAATRLIRDRFPVAGSLLDVGCGTGAHLATFRKTFDHVEGLELSAAMRDVAVRRLPGIPVHLGDMRSFAVGRRFSAVTCLFTAIAYLGSVAEMRRAVLAMAGHLVPGGVLLVEPWWFPDQFIEGYVGSDLVRDGGRVITRVSRTTLEDRVARMEVHWTVGEPTGIQCFTNVEAFTLFTRQEYHDALADAGLTVEYLPGEPTEHGLFVGTLLTSPT